MSSYKQLQRLSKKVHVDVVVHMRAKETHERVHNRIYRHAVAVQLRLAVHDGMELRVGARIERKESDITGKHGVNRLATGSRDGGSRQIEMACLALKVESEKKTRSEVTRYCLLEHEERSDEILLVDRPLKMKLPSLWCRSLRISALRASLTLSANVTLTLACTPVSVRDAPST